MSSRGTNTSKIASRGYEDRLMDIFTAQYYDRLLPEYEPDMIRETSAGAHRPGRATEMDGWLCLGAAVVAQALADWMDLFEDVRGRAEEDILRIRKAAMMREIEESLMASGFGETALMRMRQELREAKDGWSRERLRWRLNRGARTVGRVSTKGGNRR